jgi:hypothetical protein
MGGTVALLLALAGPPAATPSPTPCAGTSAPAEIEVKAGTRVRAEPDPSAPSIAVVDADMTLPVSCRCGDYAEVRWAGLRGWVRADDTEGPRLESAAIEGGAERIARARQGMQPQGREARLGPWRLVTDVPAGELKGLDAVAAHLPEAFTSRTGLATRPIPGQAVAIFSSDGGYESFAQTDGRRIPAIPGHVRAGLAAMAVGFDLPETRARLVHELTHLLSRNALGEGIPPWLDEGLSEDLAWCRVDAAGRLRPDTLDVHVDTIVTTTGVVHAREGPLIQVREWLASARAGLVPPLTPLLSPDSRFFSDSAERLKAITTSAMLVRWCLADSARAAAFQEFLTAVSLGGATDANALAAALGTDVPGLQKAFLKYLRGL